MKRLTITLSILAASLALAATTTLGAQGAGAMRDAAGNEFTFSINVKKTISGTIGTRPRVNGAAFFRRKFAMNDNKFVLEYAMPVGKGFAKNGGTATFEGPGMMNMYKNGVLISSSPGAIWASVSDMRAANSGDGPPDSMTFRFVDEGGNPPVEFSGPVLRGDVSVFEQASK
ncbi:MAG: hypothetical protein ABL949_14435 [Fimbriimonadaceae bacterium]